jgi:hypothetical protein
VITSLVGQRRGVGRCLDRLVAVEQVQRLLFSARFAEPCVGETLPSDKK